MSNLKKPSLTDRVMALLTGGDKAKLTRFEVKLVKYFNKQIAMRKETIANLRDKIVDATEALSEAVTGVNVDSINNTDSQESYCSIYVSNLDNKLKVVEQHEASIAVQEKEIARFEKLVAVVFGEEVSAE